MFALTFARLLLGLGFQSESASVLTDVGLCQMASYLQTSGVAEKALFTSCLVLVHPGAEQSGF